MIKDFLRSKLTRKQIRRLKNLRDDLKTIGSGGDLDKLAQLYNTDKFGEHFYTPHYKLHFEKFRFKKINLLEIGVGGYENPEAGGGSLRMWKRFFPNGRIYSLDIHDKSFLQEHRIKIFRGSQVDKTFLEDIVKTIGEIDIIIDDGSHINEHVIESFKFLFPKLKDGGIYAIEDTQTSYWEDFGGDSNDLNNGSTLMTFFKNLTDGLNHKEFVRPGYQPGYFDQKIISMHFYHNLIFIYKGNNDEESKYVVNNQRV